MTLSLNYFNRYTWKYCVTWNNDKENSFGTHPLTLYVLTGIEWQWIYRHILNHSISMNMLIGTRHLAKLECAIYNQSKFSIDNGLAPNRRQAIICAKDGPIQWLTYSSPGLKILKKVSFENILSYCSSDKYVKLRTTAQSRQLIKSWVLRAES